MSSKDLRNSLLGTAASLAVYLAVGEDKNAKMIVVLTTIFLVAGATYFSLKRYLDFHNPNSKTNFGAHFFNNRFPDWPTHYLTKKKPMVFNPMQIQIQNNSFLEVLDKIYDEESKKKTLNNNSLLNETFAESGSKTAKFVNEKDQENQDMTFKNASSAFYLENDFFNINDCHTIGPEITEQLLCNTIGTETNPQLLCNEIDTETNPQPPCHNFEEMERVLKEEPQLSLKLSDKKRGLSRYKVSTVEESEILPAEDNLFKDEIAVWQFEDSFDEDKPYFSPKSGKSRLQSPPTQSKKDLSNTLEKSADVLKSDKNGSKSIKNNLLMQIESDSDSEDSPRKRFRKDR